METPLYDMRMSFPRIIHQTWKNSELPTFISRCISSIKAVHPGWDYRFYEDSEMEDAISKCGEISVDDFRKIPTGIERADVFRCAVLFCEGGVYCDVDMEAVRSLDQMFLQAVMEGVLSGHEELLMTTDHPIHCVRMFGYDVVMNNFIMAQPGARFLGSYLREVGLSVREGGLGGDPVHTTGPARITRLIASNGGASACGIGLLPSVWINPLPDLTLNYPEIKEYEQMVVSGTWRKILNPYLVHHWWHSYCSDHSNVSRYGEVLWREGADTWNQ